MKVFIRSSELGGKAPDVLAFYPDDSEVPADAHGPDATMLVVPKHVLRQSVEDRGELSAADARPPPLPKLADDWRETSAQSVVEAEAKRRTEEVFTSSEQAQSLHELLVLILRHGTEISRWPPDAKKRKAEIDDLWNYADALTERARALKSLPQNPASDKIWPTRKVRGWSENKT